MTLATQIIQNNLISQANHMACYNHFPFFFKDTLFSALKKNEIKSLRKPTKFI